MAVLMSYQWDIERRDWYYKIKFLFRTWPKGGDEINLIQQATLRLAIFFIWF